MPGPLIQEFIGLDLPLEAGQSVLASSSYTIQQTTTLVCIFPLSILTISSTNVVAVDTYQHQAASALAAKTFLRSIWGASVVLFTEQMYDRMNYQWASTFLAFLGLACCAIPYAFYFKGEAIRRYSKYAFADDEEQQGAEKQ